MTFGSGFYPVALSAGLEAGTSAGAKVFGAEMVVWRAGDGSAHVWEDRCPHRGMRLSFGFVRANHIACLYHGWQFDAAGQCRLIPAHPQIDVPETIRVTRHAGFEGLGMIWAFAAPDGSAAGTLPAATPVLPETRADQAVRSLYVDRPAKTLAEHLLARVEGGMRQVADLPLFAFRLFGSDVLAGLQPIDDATAALHLLAETGADRTAIAFWAEHLRFDIELEPKALRPPGRHNPEARP